MRSIFLAALLLIGAPAFAYAEDSVVEEKGYSLKDSLGLGLSVGVGSGIDPAAPYVSSSLGIRPSLKLPMGFRLLSSLGISRELTDEDNNPERNETKLSDLYFMLNHRKLIQFGEADETRDFSVQGMARVYLPTSEISQLTGLNAATRVGARLRIATDQFGFEVDAEFHKNFHEAATASLEDCSAAAPTRPLPTFQFDPNEFVASTFAGSGACSGDVQLVSHFFLYQFGVGTDFTKQLNVSLSYTIVDSVGYDNRSVTCEELGVLGCEQGQEVGHNPGFDTHHRYTQTFGVSVNYSLPGGYSLSGAVGNTLPQRKSNATDFYNPFLLYWNSSNFTTVSVGLSKSL